MTDTGHTTTINHPISGPLVIHTRFPWAAFNKKWQDEFVRLARFHAANAPAGWELEKVVIDHVNIANETYHPRVDLRQVGAGR